MTSRQDGSALIIATMALLAVGLAAVALLRLEGQSWQLDHSRQAGLGAQRIRTAVEVYALRHGAIPQAGPLSWKELGLPPQEVSGFILEGDCTGWALSSAGTRWRFPSPDGCQAPKAGG